MRRLEWPAYYILSGHLPVAVDAITFGKWFGKADRKVAGTVLGKVSVSTVFLGMDHNWGEGDPLLFETMVFGGPMDGQIWRYSTWEEAERGHESAVAAAALATAVDAIKRDAGAEVK